MILGVEPYYAKGVGTLLKELQSYEHTSGMRPEVALRVPVTDTTPVVVRAEPGTTVHVFVNGTLVHTGGAAQESTIHELRLERLPKINEIRVTDGGVSEYSILVAADYIANILLTVAEYYNTNVTGPLNRLADKVKQPWSIARYGHLMSGAAYLPNLADLRVLCGRMLLDAQINHPGTEKGIRDALTAITGSTPVFRNLPCRQGDWDPSRHMLLAEIAGWNGHEANIWTSSIGALRWSALGRVLNNSGHVVQTYNDSVAVIDGPTKDSPIVLRPDTGPGGVNELSPTLDRVACNGRLRVVLAWSMNLNMYFNGYGIPYDMAVEYPGIGLGDESDPTHFDNGDEFDSGGELDTALQYDAAPELLLDGWVGQPTRWFDGDWEMDSVHQVPVPELPDVTGSTSEEVSVLVTRSYDITITVLPGTHNLLTGEIPD